MVNLYVGITDYDWYRFLTAQPNIEEVNFWQLRRMSKRLCPESYSFFEPRDISSWEAYLQFLFFRMILIRVLKCHTNIGNNVSGFSIGFGDEYL